MIQEVSKGAMKCLKERRLFSMGKSEFLTPKIAYDFITSNNTKHIKLVLRHARNTPITYKLGKVRDMIQQWFTNRKEEGLQIEVLTRWLEDKIEKRKIKI